MCFVSTQLRETYKKDPFLSIYYTKSVVTAFRCEIFMYFNTRLISKTNIWSKSVFTVSISIKAWLFKSPHSFSLSHLLTTVRAWLPTTGPSLTYQLMTWRSYHRFRKSACWTLCKMALWRSGPHRTALISWKLPPHVGTLGGSRRGGH